MFLNTAPNTSVIIENKEYLYFSGTSYLGVSTDEKFQNQLVKSIQKWGTSYGSSRDANLKLSIYGDAENFLSSFLETEETITVSSGTLAGLLALKLLATKTDSFFYMPKTHPAILPDNACPVFVNNELNSEILNSKKDTICIVGDAIAALEIAPFSFDFLNEIPKSTKLFLLIDESHSLGVLGKDGNGIANQIKKPANVETIQVSSLGKAFGLNGGFISGKSSFINSIKKDALFIGSAGMNPAFLDCFLNSAALYKNKLAELKSNTSYLFSILKDNPKIRIKENYPVLFCDEDAFADYLFTKNTIITSFYYASVPQKMNRIVIHANHTKEQLDVLIAQIQQFSK